MKNRILFILKITLPDILLFAILYSLLRSASQHLFNFGSEWGSEEFYFYLCFNICIIVVSKLLYFRHELKSLDPEVLNAYNFSLKPRRTISTKLNLEAVIRKVKTDMDYASLPMEINGQEIKLSVPWYCFGYGWQYVVVRFKSNQNEPNLVEIESYSKYLFPIFGQRSGLFRNVIKVEKMIAD